MDDQVNGVIRWVEDQVEHMERLEKDNELSVFDLPYDWVVWVRGNTVKSGEILLEKFDGFEGVNRIENGGQVVARHFC